jgi:hypothetical protein
MEMGLRGSSSPYLFGFWIFGAMGQLGLSDIFCHTHWTGSDFSWIQIVCLFFFFFFGSSQNCMSLNLGMLGFVQSACL